jgi:hypothetical protein
MEFDSKRKAVCERIKHRQQAIVRAKEYLQSGKHANWQGFSPLFVDKIKDGEVQPPHRDWVKNVFLPNAEKRLKRDEKVLELLEEKHAIKR